MGEKLINLSAKETDVMSVLWRENKDLTASQIAQAGELKLNTVKVALPSLLKKGYVKVADIVYSRTVLSRSYRYSVSAEKYAAQQLKDMRNNTYSFSTLNFMEQFVKHDDRKDEILKELEEAIKKLKEED